MLFRSPNFCGFPLLDEDVKHLVIVLLAMPSRWIGQEKMCGLLMLSISNMMKWIEWLGQGLALLIAHLLT